MATLPQGVGINTSLQYTDKPTNTFIVDWSSKQIMGMDTGLAAMRQAVEIILRNERFRWQIYDSNFGSELEDLTGEDYDYIISEIPRRVAEAFSVDSRILAVENFAFTNNHNGTMAAAFDVVTVFGVISQEVAV